MLEKMDIVPHTPFNKVIISASWKLRTNEKVPSRVNEILIGLGNLLAVGGGG
jgi:hypothetical protein